eukprot:Polyplicarium_translucidae@DN1706_c0_g1_i1.p2
MLCQAVFLTGRPGVGKTSLLKKIIGSLTLEGFDIHGFYTEEVRTAEGRVGFDAVPVTGGSARTPLARVRSAAQGPTVGKYSERSSPGAKAAVRSCGCPHFRSLRAVGDRQSHRMHHRAAPPPGGGRGRSHGAIQPEVLSGGVARIRHAASGSVRDGSGAQGGKGSARSRRAEAKK